MPPKKKAESSTKTTTASNDEQPTGTANPSANPASDGEHHDFLDAPVTETKTVEVQAQVPVDRDEEPVKSENVDTDFVHVQSLDPRRNIPGTSQYLDQVERRNAEIIRAKAEDREPDLENPPAFQGSLLVTKAQATQVGLNPDVDGAEGVTLPVVTVESEVGAEPFVTYDGENGRGASTVVNTGVPV